MRLRAEMAFDPPVRKTSKRTYVHTGPNTKNSHVGSPIPKPPETDAMRRQIRCRYPVRHTGTPTGTMRHKNA